MMGTLYFKRSNGEKVLVQEGLAEKELYPTITAVVARMNPKYKIHYVRSWTSTEDSSVTVYDVGSHTEFFLYQRDINDEKASSN